MLALEFAGLSLRLPIGTRRSTAGDNDPNPAEFTASDWRRSYEQASLARMSDNLRALGQRATWSLVAGVGFAAAGVALLFTSSIMLEQPAITDQMAFILHYAPRLSITIIVELVAFFFLRTYARTLTDIRYVQNEFTNIEMKLTDLHTSIEKQYADITKNALSSLMSTERNHILEKGQSSVEMERERVENESFIAGAKAFAGVFGRGNGKVSE